MKKVLFLALLTLATAGQMKAQDVFKEVVANAKSVIDDPKANAFNLSIAQFKYTALNYFANTAIKQNGEVSKEALDTQAMALNDFITSYLTKLVQAQKSSDTDLKSIMKKYWKATSENPMFEKQDKEVTESFANDPASFTPFSLNTDWVKANEQVNKK